MAAVSKRLRFEVLRRDNFACYYCGAKASPDNELVVDAVVPEALGGSHKDPANLHAACEPCNSGKSATPPDAPLVTEVAKDALRWSEAMKAAAAEALADSKRLDETERRFAELWDMWTYRDNYGNRQKYPKDPGWPQSVSALIAAGLTMALLEECIQIAMAKRKLNSEDRFRYMCGVAWNKVTELQERAREIADKVEAANESAGDDGDGSADYNLGRLELARELLDDIPQEERDYFLADADLTGYVDEPQTETELASEAVSFALNSIQSNWDWLAGQVEKFLRGIPGGIGEHALDEAEKPSPTMSPYAGRAWYLAEALRETGDALREPAALKYLDAMAEDERSEWLEYADALFGGATLTTERRILRAADCARAIKEQDQYYPDMCCLRGRVIPNCPTLGTFRVWLNETECCKEADHPGHVVCERHLNEFIDGTHPRFTVRDFTAIDQKEREKAPF